MNVKLQFKFRGEYDDIQFCERSQICTVQDFFNRKKRLCECIIGMIFTFHIKKML